MISWLDGEPDITPTDPRGWARELGRGLALVHALPAARLAELPSVFDLPLGRTDLDAEELRRRHAQWTARLRESS